jgi:hypothetical protein
MILSVAVCDRCDSKQETKGDLRTKFPKGWAVIIDTQTEARKPAHLCPKCTIKLRNWLNNEPDMDPLFPIDKTSEE